MKRPMDQKVNLEIGPGYYDPERAEVEPIYKYNQNSVFASSVGRNKTSHSRVKKVIRGKSRPITAANQLSKYNLRQNLSHAVLISDSSSESEDADVTPGPGYYQSGDTNFKPKDVPQNYQFFGSGVERFEISRSHDRELGPGAYNSY